MARAPGVYVPLSVNYMRDSRIRNAGPEAELLYIRALAYAKSSETDGEVPAYDLPVIAVGLPRARERVTALVREGAWEERPGGWFIAGWFNWNERISTLRDKKQRQAHGAAKTNHKKHVNNGLPFIGNCLVCLGEVDEA